MTDVYSVHQTVNAQEVRFVTPMATASVLLLLHGGNAERIPAEMVQVHVAVTGYVQITSVFSVHQTTTALETRSVMQMVIVFVPPRLHVALKNADLRRIPVVILGIAE
ncbi:MAG: hypothetical protein HYT09_03995 [Candidatus Levybacteria bacterium]|nr:hypothetical protein [Candidatus Levybacteria bacterium]